MIENFDNWESLPSLSDADAATLAAVAADILDSKRAITSP